MLDPVGVGASKFRGNAVKREGLLFSDRLINGQEDLLDICQASVIKGNAGELAALAGTNEVGRDCCSSLQNYADMIVGLRLSRRA